MHIKVNIVIQLTDGYTNSDNIQGMVKIYAQKKKLNVIKKSGGCYVIYNCEEGLYEINIECSNYIKQTFKVGVDENIKTLKVELMPNKNYNFFASTVKIMGKLKADKQAFIVFMLDKTRLINVCKKGENKLKISFPFDFEQKEIYISNGVNYGIYSLTKGEPYEYYLDKPLDFEADTASVFGIAYKVKGDEKGEYFLAVKGVGGCAAFIYKDHIEQAKVWQGNNKHNFKGDD